MKEIPFTTSEVPNHGYKNLWISPQVPILRMRHLIESYGLERVLAHPLAKPEREAWTTAIFLLGNGIQTGLDYWIEIETDAATPDTYGYVLEEKDGHLERWVVEFEITDCEEHGPGLLEVIKKKCAKKYPPSYFLLVYYRIPGPIDLRPIVEGIQKVEVPFARIYVIANVGEDEYQIAYIHPKSEVIVWTFNLATALAKVHNISDFATTLKRDSGTTPTPLGLVSLLYPDLNRL